MHSSTIVTFFTLAMAVLALPTDKPKDQPSGCTASSANKCCNGFNQGLLGLIGLQCTNIIGATCSGNGNAACCTSQNNGLVVVDICQVAI